MIKKMNELNSLIVQCISDIFDEKICYHELDDLSVVCREKRVIDGKENGWIAHVSIDIDRDIYRAFASSPSEERSEIFDILNSNIRTQLLQYDKDNIGIDALSIKVTRDVLQ